MSKESVYDERIFPLMQQIIALCKEEKISLIADFGLDDDLHCTTAVLKEECAPSERQLQALQILNPPSYVLLTTLVETKKP